MIRISISGKIVLSILIALFCIRGSAQSPPVNPYVSNRNNKTFVPDYSISKDDLLSDIDMYIEKIDKVHPDPYRLISKNDFISEINKIKSKIQLLSNDNLNIFDCYYYLQRIAVLIKDGHTKIYNPRNWDKLISSFFPLNIKILEGRAFINQNFGDNKIPLKVEILSINKINVKDIFTEMLKYCEGTLHEYKLARLEEELRYYLHTFYKFKSPWKLEYVFNGKKKKVLIEGINHKLLVEKNRKNRWFSQSSIKNGNEEIPIFKLPHLGYRKKDFKPVIDKFFKNNFDKKKIVFDLRGCPGGNGLRTYDVVDHLLDLPYSISKKFMYRVSKALKDYIKYYIQDYLFARKKPISQWRNILYKSGIWNDEYDEMYKIVLNSGLNTFARVQNISHIPDKKTPKYKGNIFILVDHRSFSAAVVFASVFKHYKLAKIVGRETGGRIDFFSDTISIELPNSKLISKIPTALMTLQGDKAERGIIPDRIVRYTINDFLNENDPDIETIKNVKK